MSRFVRLPIAAGTHYAELVEQLLMSAEGPRTGSFVAKEIKGRRYWYLQQRTPGAGQRQTYVGADTPEVRERMETARKRWGELRRVASDHARIGAMAAAGGAYVHAPAEVRLLRLLADRGVFRVGTVLVGSLAFGVLGNMLGVRWPAASTRTRDVDLAHDPRITLAVARDAAPLLAPGPGEAASAGLQLSPIPPLHHKHPSTSFRVLGTELHVDLLTPLVGRERTSPNPHPRPWRSSDAASFSRLPDRRDPPRGGRGGRGGAGQRSGRGALRASQARRRRAAKRCPRREGARGTWPRRRRSWKSWRWIGRAISRSHGKRLRGAAPDG